MFSREPSGNHPGTRARNGVDCRTKPPVGLCKTTVRFCAGPQKPIDRKTTWQNQKVIVTTIVQMERLLRSTLRFGTQLSAS